MFVFNKIMARQEEHRAMLLEARVYRGQKRNALAEIVEAEAAKYKAITDGLVAHVQELT